MNRRLLLLGLILFISFANAWGRGNINTDRIRKSKLVTKADTVNAPPVNTITIDRTNLKITPTVCGQNDGAITGLKITAGKNLKTLWVSDFDRSHTYVTLDLVNIPPGRYELTVADDYSSVIAGKFTVPAIGGIDLDTSKVVKINETCGQKNGSITGLHIRNETFNEVVSWTDSRGQQVANKLDAKGLTSGYYYLTIMYDNLSCPISYGPVRLQNTGGPILDESNAYVTLANCNCENASVTGIKVKGTGKITYEWLTTQGYTKSNDLDLFGAGCEAYVLKVSDESGCGPTYSNLYRLPRPATPAPKPQPDYSKMVITKGTCSDPASVTGMRWSAYSKCYWIDQSGTIVSNTFDLIDVPSGFYYFYIEDPCGNNFKIDFDLGPPQIRLSNYSAVVSNICGNNTTGGIKINTTADIKKIRWVDATGQQVGEGREITGLPAGDYQAFLTNYYGCEDLYKTYTIKKVTAPEITPNTAIVSNERCGSKTGSVKGIKVTGGVKPYHFTWLDNTGNIVDTLLDVKGLSAGTYTLVIHDSGGCTFNAAQYNIINDTGDLAAPVIGNVNVCDPGFATIPAGPEADGYRYRLYETATSPVPIAEETSGKIKVSVDVNRSFFVSQAIGSCESPRTEVFVITGLSAPKTNAFSPNGDGINEIWKIPGIELFPKANIMVFNRAGAKVFESVGYATPFNGTYNGKQLSPGTYYYVINPNTGCSFRSGNLTIIR